jgi:uncharacterized protein (TIGR03435 family)
VRLLAVAAIAIGVVAQIRDPAPQTPAAFEVASIKAHPLTDNEGVRVTPSPGGRLTITNASLRLLITFAYGIQDSQVFGGPDWAGTATFDVTAKADRDVPGIQLYAMLRPVLADRFKLSIQHALRDIPVYALVIARNNEKVGAQLKRSDLNCSGTVEIGARACQFSTGFGNLHARGMPLTALASTLSRFAGRVVVDRTGLSGPYDFDLTWTPDQVRERAAGGQPVVENGRTIDPNGPSLFTAVQEQLGLKLDARKEPVDVLIIDHAEKPSND